MDILERVHEIGVVPVVVLNKVEDTIPTIQALHDGDVPVAEICFRTACAAECIKLAAKEFPNDLIGAGTVINAKQCEEALLLSLLSTCILYLRYPQSLCMNRN